MSDTSTLNQTAVSASFALKVTKPIAWASIAHAHTEAIEAGSTVIAPSDLLVGILLNHEAIKSHHALEQLGVKRTDKTIDLLRANRTAPSCMRDILLSNLFGRYRRLVEETVNLIDDRLTKELSALGTETIPHTEELAKDYVRNLKNTGMSEDDAMQAVKELHVVVQSELATVNELLKTTQEKLKERTIGITASHKLLSSWIWSINKYIYPNIKADDVGNIFSKESQKIICLSRDFTEGTIDNHDFLFGLAADTDGPGQTALNVIGIDPIQLQGLVRNSK